MERSVKRRMEDTRYVLGAIVDRFGPEVCLGISMIPRHRLEIV
jgi:hypothetical protein